MPARRDTRREATRVRRLSPLQTVEDQSQAWGIRCHSCTWREGFAPSWNTELQGSYLPCGLPGSRSFLSTNGSHLNKRGVDLVVAYPALADNVPGPLPSRLRRLTQPIMSPPHRFSTPRLSRLACI